MTDHDALNREIAAALGLPIGGDQVGTDEFGNPLCDPMIDYAGDIRDAFKVVEAMGLREWWTEINYVGGHAGERRENPWRVRMTKYVGLDMMKRVEEPPSNDLPPAICRAALAALSKKETT